MSLYDIPLAPPPPVKPPATRATIEAKALKSIKTLLRKGGVNMAEWQARLHETEMVELLVAFARDPTKPAEFRRDCAKDVLDRARGKVTAAIRLEAADVGSPDEDSPFGQDVIDAQVAADGLVELQSWLAVPVEQWPAGVKAKYQQEVELLARADGDR